MENPYTLAFEDRGNYLYAHLTGKDSFESGLEYWRAIADKTLELGHKRVLVHENMLGDLNKAEVFEIITQFTKPAYLGIRLAFFDENIDDESLNALGQLVATNRGIMVEVFQTLKAAQHWIESNE